MHTTVSRLVAIAQYFWRIRTSLFFVYQQKFNIEAVNDYAPIRDSIRIRIVAADSIRTKISDSQVPTSTIQVYKVTQNTKLLITLIFRPQ